MCELPIILRNFTEIFTIPRTSATMRTNFLLILGLCAVNLQKTLVEDICFEKDEALVEVDVIYDDHCVDIEGVIYILGSELMSCCDCFRLVSSKPRYNSNKKRGGALLN